MTIIDFVSDYNVTYKNHTNETLEPETIIALQKIVAEMMQFNCGELVNFEITDKGELVLL